jgi:hypothetical protein
MPIYLPFARQEHDCYRGEIVNESGKCVYRTRHVYTDADMARSTAKQQWDAKNREEVAA